MPAVRKRPDRVAIVPGKMGGKIGETATVVIAIELAIGEPLRDAPRDFSGPTGALPATDFRVRLIVEFGVHDGEVEVGLLIVPLPDFRVVRLEAETNLATATQTDCGATLKRSETASRNS